MAYRTIPESTRREAMDLYRRGMSGAAVARRLGLSGYTVLRWAQAEGIHRGVTEARRVRRSRELALDYGSARQRGVAMLRAANVPARLIAEAVGVSVGAVRAWAEAEGIDLVARRRERGWHAGRK